MASAEVKLMTTYVLEWERRVDGGWEKRSVSFSIYFPGGLTVFEIESMAAGLRAEVKNIRHVHVAEKSEVTKYLS